MSKIIVDVIAHNSVEGVITPLQIIWKDGQKYTIDKVSDRRRAASLKAGGYGIRYTCRINGQIKYMWLEELPDGGTHWFVEGK